MLQRWSPCASSEKNNIKQPSDGPDVRTCTRLDKGQCARVVIPLPLMSERGRGRVCVCGCERAMESARRELLSETRGGGAVLEGHAWFQRYGCEFVTGITLEAGRRRTCRCKEGGNERSIPMS